MNDDIKLVIVMRNDLNMRKGKIAAQAAHSSMAWLTNRLSPSNQSPIMDADNNPFYQYDGIILYPHEQEWVRGIFTKVCLQIGSEQELRDIHQKAIQADIQSHLITDSGKTEFKGVPTITCCGIGPDYSSKINQITGHLKLY